MRLKRLLPFDRRGSAVPRSAETRGYFLSVDRQMGRSGPYSPAVGFLQSLSSGRHLSVVAIDGRCASGKTTLAASLSRRFSCNVFHMDDFFLPLTLHTRERLAQPGGNVVDYERFRKEVLEPASKGETVCLRPFDCSAGRIGPSASVPPAGMVLVEGSYAMHPALWDCYDGGIFLTCSPEEQLRRLAARESPAQLERFLSEWIPLEERYFSFFSIESRCDLTLDTTSFDNRR